MNAVSSLRIPTAFVTALLITGGLFTALNSMTTRTFQVVALETTPIEFVQQRLDTPEQSRRIIDKPIAPPKVEIETPRIEAGEFDEATTVLVTQIDPNPGVTVPNSRSTFGSDTEAVPVVRVAPMYPQRALANGVEGWVRVRFTISETGAVTDAMVVESSPTRVFDDAALTAIARWRYNPKVEEGTAVERRGVETLLRFSLSE